MARTTQRANGGAIHRMRHRSTTPSRPPSAPHAPSKPLNHPRNLPPILPIQHDAGMNEIDPQTRLPGLETIARRIRRAVPRRVIQHAGEDGRGIVDGDGRIGVGVAEGRVAGGDVLVPEVGDGLHGGGVAGLAVVEDRGAVDCCRWLGTAWVCVMGMRTYGARGWRGICARRACTAFPGCESSCRCRLGLGWIRMWRRHGLGMPGW